MKLSELRAREALDDRLEATLLSCIRMDAGYGSGKGEEVSGLWYEHPFFSVFVKRGFCEEGRRYLRSQYMYSPVRRRRIVQAATVGLMSAGPVFDRSLRAGVSLPDGDAPEHQMWMIGNHRVRRFDFSRGVVHVYPKSGFSDEGICREIAFRKRIQRDWMLPLLSSEGAMFAEPLLEAVPLDRVPGDAKREAALEAAVSAVESLNEIERHTVSSADYLAVMREEYGALKARVHARFPGLELSRVDEMFASAAQVIARARAVEVGMTHGDFQPGNVLVPRGSEGAVRLIDWEDVRERASIYDVLTWRLQSRRPSGLCARVRSFLVSGDISPFRLPCSVELAVALWAVEEWRWLLESNSREGIARVPQGLILQFAELNAFFRK